MILHENCLLAILMKYHIFFFFQKLIKMSQNLLSAAVVISALRVRLLVSIHTTEVNLKHFSDRSKAGLLLWIIYVISVLFCYSFMQVCLLMPCGHLLEKG